MSEENTTQGSFLSTEEQILLAHYHARNFREIMELILTSLPDEEPAEAEAESSAPAEIPVSPEPEQSKWLDGAERMSLILLGKLAEHAVLTREIISGVNGQEPELLHWLWFDIAEGIREGLVAMDEQELIHLHRGVK